MSEEEKQFEDQNKEEEEEEEDQPKIITPADIKESCIKNKLYTVPELNETLYLHYNSYQKIASLEPYVNLTSLWLNNNLISTIEGLSSCNKLICLYLNDNGIEEINGLNELVNLETLVLSNNFISKIENLSSLKKLHTFEIDNNNIKTTENIKGILEVPSLVNLNLSKNKLETEDFLPIVSQMKSVTVLKMMGNPIARLMSQYRRKIIAKMPQLTFLDESPVNELEVRCSRAYMEDGREAEKIEREKYYQEKEDIKTKNRKELRRANRKYALENGIDISNDKYLMSSDDERLFKSSDDEDNPKQEENPKKEKNEDGKIKIQIQEDID